MTVEILVVCTANLCRSPMAGALLTQRLGALGVDATVSTAGTRAAPGRPAVPDAIAVMADDGLDITAHRSRRAEPELVARADLVVAMEREHVRELALAARGDWGRVFTLKELARLTQTFGARTEATPLRDWATSLGADRTSASLLAAGPDDDMRDPIGRPRREFRRVRDAIDQLWAELLPTLFGS